MTSTLMIKSFYSLADPKILDQSERLRIGKQLLGVLKSTTKGKNLSKCRILDIGCSSGIITHLIAQFCTQITGVETDKKALSLAKKNFQRKNLEFLEMDGTKLSINDNYFDIVICNQVHFYVKDSDKLISEIYRVLKTGGICFFSSSNSYYQLYLKNFTDQAPFIHSIKSSKELKKLCQNFKITDYTFKILSNPKKYGFTKLEKYQTVFNLLPISFWVKFTFALPNSIWILEKV